MEQEEQQGQPQRQAVVQQRWAVLLHCPQVSAALEEPSGGREAALCPDSSRGVLGAVVLVVFGVRLTQRGAASSTFLGRNAGVPRGRAWSEQSRLVGMS